MKILSNKDKNNIRESLKETYGLDLDGVFLITGTNKVRFFNGQLSIKEISNMLNYLTIESAGIYLGKNYEEGFRLSFDAANLFQKNINKNIIEISKDQLTDWFKGENIKTDKNLYGFYIIKHNNDVIGCAKVSNGTIYNYVPKEMRKLK